MALSLLLASRALACDMCTVYSCPPAPVAAPLDLELGFAGQYTRFGSLRLDGARVPNEAGQRLHSSVAQFLAGYRVSDRFSLQVDVPYIYRSFRRPREETLDHGAVSGPGDLVIFGLLRPYRFADRDRAFAWDVLGGVKVPTGDSERLQEELTETPPAGARQPSAIHGHDLALGSGSYDGVAGTELTARWRRLVGSASLHGFLRTEGDLEYRYANELDWTVKPGVYLWLTEPNALSLKCVVHGETKGRDTFRGERAEDTGMRAVFVGPELNFTRDGAWNATLALEFPVELDNTALQAVPDQLARAALSWRF